MDKTDFLAVLNSGHMGSCKEIQKKIFTKLPFPLYVGSVRRRRRSGSRAGKLKKDSFT